MHQKFPLVPAFCSILLLFVSHRTAAEEQKHDSYPVRYSSAVQLDGLDSIKTKWNTSDVLPEGQNWEWYNDDGETAFPGSCEDYHDLSERGYREYSTTFDIVQKSFFQLKCTTLALLVQAKPSKKSFVSDFRLSAETVSQIPPLGLEELHEDSAPNVSWKEYDSNLTARMEGNNNLEVKSGATIAVLTYLVTGDFNEDGVEDLLFFVARSLTEGSMRAYDHMILTRTEPEGKLKIVRLINEVLNLEAL